MSDQPSNSYVLRPAGYDDDEEDEMNYSPRDASQESASNLKIRVVKSLGFQAGLFGTHFDITLPPEVQEWLDNFTKTFNTFKKGPVISQGIRMLYGTRGDLFELVLKLFANAPSSSNPKTGTLAYAFVKELDDYLKAFDQNDVYAMQHFGVNENLKMVAFNFFNAHGKLFTIITNCYNLKSSRSMFIAPIKAMIAERKYKDACQIAFDLELYEEFSIHDFIVPLILQDRMTVAELYLEKAPELQQKLVKFLDTWLDHSQPFANYYDNYLGEVYIPEVNYSKLHRKTLKKLVKRYLEVYKIPKEMTPFLQEMEAYGMLQLFITKKYSEKSLTDWDEFIKESVHKESERLIQELIDGCIYHNDIPEAVKWLKYFQADVDRYPSVLKDYLDGKVHAKEEEDVEEVPYYVESYTINESKIHLIDRMDNFYRMIGDLVRYTIIGFDAEWKFGESDIDLIQLASSARIYLIDVKVLKNILGTEDWRKLARKIFNNEEILKLGFSQASDIAMLRKALPALALNYEKNTSYMDLQKLWRYLLGVPGFKFPFPDNSVGRAKQDLRQLVTLCLGRPLDKSQQFSNWAKRPLKQQQIVYAASDAYCLIEAYNVMKLEAQRLHIDLYDYDLCKRLK